LAFLFKNDGLLFSFKKEILVHTSAQMNLEYIKLSEISQAEKTNMVWFHLYEVTKVVTLIQKVEWWLLGVESYHLTDTEFEFCPNEKVLEMAAQRCEYT
jgi:hypothetical protein